MVEYLYIQYKLKFVSNSASVMDEKNTDYVALIPQDDSIEYKFEEAVNFIENKVINAGGLTLAEVFQVASSNARW